MRSAYMASGEPGCSTAGFKMSPASPPVQQTSTLCTPSAAYLAVVPAPFEASSSGWAWTWSRASRSSVTPGTLPVAFEREDLYRPDAPHRAGAFGNPPELVGRRRGQLGTERRRHEQLTR